MTILLLDGRLPAENKKKDSEVALGRRAARPVGETLEKGCRQMRH